ncbi:PKD domain-containing protein [Candidatus Woesearchaeota archaeon]|nr:PKD domain-containing protein [Candidatus Woesearchaeota archaeon]
MILLIPAVLSLKFTVTEGDLFKLKVTTSDPDNDRVSLVYSDPLDDKGEWQTSIGDAGDYKIKIGATDGKDVAYETIDLEVAKYVNYEPEITTQPNYHIDEGQTLELKVAVRDKNGDKIDITYSGYMSAESKYIDYDQAGNYTSFITATDGVNTAKEEINIFVNNINRAPVIANLSDIKVSEGDQVLIQLDAFDPDGDELHFWYEENVTGANITDRVFYWTPPHYLLDNKPLKFYEQEPSNTYFITFGVSDGADEAYQQVGISVQNKNLVPVPVSIQPAESHILIWTGESVKFFANVTDWDEDELEYTWSFGPLSKMTGTQAIEKHYAKAGDHEVRLEVSDGKDKIIRTWKVHVSEPYKPLEPAYVERTSKTYVLWS